MSMQQRRKAPTQSSACCRDYVTSLDSTGTFAWAAPELLLGRRCTEKVDIYSFGVVLWEIVTGERPMRGQTRALRWDDSTRRGKHLSPG
jgi:serine/threonine protein kinase